MFSLFIFLFWSSSILKKTYFVFMYSQQHLSTTIDSNKYVKTKLKNINSSQILRNKNIKGIETNKRLADNISSQHSNLYNQYRTFTVDSVNSFHPNLNGTNKKSMLRSQRKCATKRRYKKKNEEVHIISKFVYSPDFSKAFSLFLIFLLDSLHSKAK